MYWVQGVLVMNSFLSGSAGGTMGVQVGLVGQHYYTQALLCVGYYSGFLEGIVGVQVDLVGQFYTQFLVDHGAVLAVLLGESLDVKMDSLGQY